MNPNHEFAAVTQAAHRGWGKAIFFHEVTGSARPVLSNIYGSRERLAEILGIGPMDFCGLWTIWHTSPVPATFVLAG